MKDIKFLGMLFCLCLLSCGGKAQEAEKKKTGELPQPGAYGFPKEMDVKCEVVLKVTFNYSLDNVTWTRSSVYPWAHGREVYEETIAPELLETFRNTLMGESPLFAGVDYTTEIPLYNYSASSVKKGLYKILFGINYKPCYVIFEL